MPQLVGELQEPGPSVGALEPPRGRGGEIQPAATRTLDFVKLSEWAGDALTAQARPLIKGLLDQGAMSVLYGDSNVGKTFVTMDLAFHIARGMPWGGMKTTRKVAAYVAAEGGQGARKRGAALLRKYGACDDFHILPEPVDLLREGADLRPLIKALKELGDDLGLVVIDTLSRALAGGDENSSTDMGAVVRNLDAIRNAVSAHVLVVHHTGKDKARGARGHSLLRAATDTEIEVAEKQITVTKQRDLEKSYASAFELDVVTLGKDEDGDPVTSCTLRLVARRAEVAPGLATPTEQQILDGLQACADTAADPRAGVPQAELVAFFDRPEFGPEKLRFHLREMLKKNLVERVSRGCWRTRCPNENSVTTWFEPQEVPLSPERSGGSPLVGGVFD
ncbi:helicase RepA family protein [Methylobacterium sp. J-059]|uniref:helicase RepA family protein n=1 Tax=Methylobacterium sp. J-059 TaxID=2836643 RepID=UPI001FBB594C|nr:helicase RepA family protein [Methylobacterium sp. J-059]MCJ2040287.1 helicase RepA family protein [Methylobacterium sp. J-059]